MFKRRNRLDKIPVGAASGVELGPILLGYWIRRFLLEHLVSDRNLARNTQRSYRDTFRLLLPFVAGQTKRAVDKLCVTDISHDVIRRFLVHIEGVRGCSSRTRNQRLASIHALAKFIAGNAPEFIGWAADVRGIPFKRFERPALCYLEKPEMDALLAAPKQNTPQGRRDHALLLFLYNAGARASEAAGVMMADLTFHPDGSGSVRLLGKGAKVRYCPLWPTTMAALRPLVATATAERHVFLNRRGQPITRYGVHAMVKRHARDVAQRVLSLRNKRVSPHTIRHTTATHLLRAGVDINTIRAWLGHVSIDTTNVYAEVDLEAKAAMLAACEPAAKKSRRQWNDDPNLMEFLRGL